LTLPARKLGTAIANERFIAIRQMQNEIMYASQLRRRHNGVAIWLAHARNILTYGAIK
jgi:hypothetical protein